MLDGMFSQSALLFTVPALAGSAVFLVKMGLMTLGGLDVDADVDVDVDADVDVDVGVDADADAGDSTAAFNLLSIQSIAAFLMGFGWGGLGGLVGLDWGLAGSLVLGAACGVGLVWLLALMLKAIYDLQSSGNVKLEEAVGHEATVYANIPTAGAGRGQVRLVLKQRARIYGAVSDTEPLPTNTRVRVVRVNADRTLTVCAAS